MLKIILTILMHTTLNNRASAMIKNFGFIPSTFPRDTIEFNTHKEQMAVGQIITPLVNTDQYGNVVPAISDYWNTSKDGLTIRFHINDRLEFSDGNKITSKDVKYSIERHWKNKNSQSHPLLANIKSISTRGEHEIEIKMRQPQVAILKILSRDHLGIVPYGWSFNKQSNEPFIGCGPYRLVRKDSDWTYVKNKRYPDEKNIKETEWRIIFLPQNPEELARIETLPDFAPSITQTELDVLVKNKKYSKKTFLIKPRMSFIQTLAWWNPKSKNTKEKEKTMFIVREMIKRRRESLNYPTSFGLIPYGISGHLQNEINPEKKPSYFYSKSMKTKESTIKILVPSRLKNEIIDIDLVSKLELKFNVKIEFIIEGDFNKKQINDFDVIINRWAGGFNDPEGFLPILNQVMKGPINKISKTLSNKLVKASREVSWSKRSELFRDFDEALVKNNWLVPAWRTPTYTFTKKPLVESENNLRYSPKIIDLTTK